MTPRMVTLVAVVVSVAAEVVVAVVVVVAAGAAVEAFSAATAVFSHPQATVFPSASESESEMTMVALSTSGTLHQCSFVEGLLEDRSPGDGLVGVKWKSSLRPVPSSQ